MNNPVAWCMQDKDGNFYDCICPEEHANYEGSYTVPLYTEPQYRELSDDEIWEIWNKNGIGVPYEFARAILKKASEK